MIWNWKYQQPKKNGTFWRSLDDWIFANSSMIKITGTEAKLLKDSRGIHKTFFPNTFECKRLINLYQRAKEIGFPGEFDLNQEKLILKNLLKKFL